LKEKERRLVKLVWNWNIFIIANMLRMTYGHARGAFVLHVSIKCDHEIASEAGLRVILLILQYEIRDKVWAICIQNHEGDGETEISPNIWLKHYKSPISYTILLVYLVSFYC
jgi:hypothetical protein